jgi:hypothetical protein
LALATYGSYDARITGIRRLAGSAMLTLGLSGNFSAENEDLVPNMHWATSTTQLPAWYRTAS